MAAVSNIIPMKINRLFMTIRIRRIRCVFKQFHFQLQIEFREICLILRS